MVNAYYNEALMSSSGIDHFFVSIALKPFIGQVCVIESSCNFSGHRPISMSMALLRSKSTAKLSKVRWDKCSLSDYYNSTRECLARLVYDGSYLYCASNCSYNYHKVCINNHYVNIVKGP